MEREHYLSNLNTNEMGEIAEIAYWQFWITISVSL